MIKTMHHTSSILKTKTVHTSSIVLTKTVLHTSSIVLTKVKKHVEQDDRAPHKQCSYAYTKLYKHLKHGTTLDFGNPIGFRLRHSVTIGMLAEHTRT